MVMQLANPWLSESTLDPATGVDAAAAPDLTDPPVAAAEAIHSLGVVVDRGTAQRLEIELRNAGCFSGPTASGAVWHGENGCSDPATPCDPTRPSQFNTDCIGEIFAGAAKIDDHRFVLDEHAFLDTIEPLPLFLRDGEHLRRWG